jgi:hypothetical protein
MTTTPEHPFITALVVGVASKYRALLGLVLKELKIDLPDTFTEEDVARVLDRINAEAHGRIKCSFCETMLLPEHAIIREHVHACSEHPMRLVEIDLAVAQARVEQLERVLVESQEPGVPPDEDEPCGCTTGARWVVVTHCGGHAIPTPRLLPADGGGE